MDSHALNIFGTLPIGRVRQRDPQRQRSRPSSRRSASTARSSSPIRPGIALPVSIYTGLQPITDTTPAVNYTFNDFGDPDQSFSATSKTVTDPSGTSTRSSSPTRPRRHSAAQLRDDEYRQQELRVQHAARVPPISDNGVIGTVNIPTPSTGLLSLTFNTPTDGTDTVSFVNTPPGVATSSPTALETT